MFLPSIVQPVLGSYSVPSSQEECVLAGSQVQTLGVLISPIKEKLQNNAMKKQGNLSGH
jgi:hypothetical protein